MKIQPQELDLIAATVRTLSMDAVQKAKSGHPGMPMGCAEIAAVLWAKILKHYPGDPAWVNRDRFVLSAGHGSMLLYSMLHLSGYDLSMEELQNFRQWGSRSPGHPEYGHTPGVETTTGPLGQGFANAVGMALAQGLLAKEFNDGLPVIDHRVYVLAGDGDLMEGISCEAASLAGHWGLGRLVVIYDSNDITIEGPTDLALSDDIEKRFESCRWHVQKIDGHDVAAIEKALVAAGEENSRPSLVIAKTRIARGSPGKEGSEESHGSPLGEEEVQRTKQNLGCDEHARFCVPSDVYRIFNDIRAGLARNYEEWQDRFSQAMTGEKRARWERLFGDFDTEDLRKKLPVFEPGKAIATRSASGKVLETLFREVPGLVGGSADLGLSNKSFVKGFGETGRNRVGRNIHFGVREHAMGAIQNGIAYYGGFIPYSATFLVFMDYMRPPMRLASLSGLQSIYLFSHDSFYVGEDGPTHQPVEHLAAARAIPGLTVIRPADAEETREAWLAALGSRTSPTALILTRQDVPTIKREKGRAEDLRRGAYVIWESDREPQILLLASGSEVILAVEAAQELHANGTRCRVISFPSWELFDKQPDDYRSSVLPEKITRRAVIEAGISMGWERYAGRNALFITLDHFGASAPAHVLADKFGFTKENVVRRVREYIAK